jgi:hypothetical protein
MAKLSTSLKAYLGLFAFVAILRIILFFIPVDYVLPNQDQMVSIPTILLIFALGLIGLHLIPKAGFAEMWDVSVSNRKRFLISILIGFGFGILSVLFNLLQPLGAGIQIKLPASLLVYLIGGVLEEIMFRLLLTTLLIWLISGVLLQGRWQNQVFWIVAVAVGLLYAFLQIGQYAMFTDQTVEPLIALRFFVVIGIFFIVAAYLFRKYGFLAAVSMRLADYVVFHIIWGGLFLR